MTRKQFIRFLDQGTESREEKLNVINYYIENYPVQIIEKNRMGIPTGRIIWTAILGVKAIEGGRQDLLDGAFKVLQKRFKDKNDKILK